MIIILKTTFENKNIISDCFQTHFNVSVLFNILLTFYYYVDLKQEALIVLFMGYK